MCRGGEAPLRFNHRYVYSTYADLCQAVSTFFDQIFEITLFDITVMQLPFLLLTLTYMYLILCSTRNALEVMQSQLPARFTTQIPQGVVPNSLRWSPEYFTGNVC